MTRDEAKRILSLYRPWAADADPEFAEALKLAQEDAELGRWLEARSAAQTALRSKLLTVKPPAGLREQILSERPTAPSPAPRRKHSVLVAALAIVVILGVAGFWISQLTSDAEEVSFDNYRSRMVRTALRLYGMSLETNSATEIRAYLANNRARADYVLPKPLAEAMLTGCDVLHWQGNPVSMVCFRSGRPLAEGEKTDLFLFVMARAAAPEAPTENTPRFVQVNKLITASWSEGDLVYVLATPGDEQFLKKFL